MSSQDLNQLQPVLDQLKISEDKLIGKGGEGHVFSFDEDKVVKIYKESSEAYLEKLQSFQQRISKANLPYQTPLIESIGLFEGTFYSIENKLEGQNLETVFAKLSEKQQSLALTNYLAALEPLKEIFVDDLPYGQVLDTPKALTSNSWKQYILNKLEQKLEFTREKLQQDVVNFSLKLETLKKMINSMLSTNPEKNFVHGDYYFTNVLVNEAFEITAVLDINEHTCVGDHRLDIANINFLSLCDNVMPGHIKQAKQLIVEKNGSEIVPYIDLYGFYYAFYFSNLYTFDMTSYRWCLSILNDETRWERYL
ncbi:MAG: hypothetical protein COY80_00890 [Candidatus Pacebacteria bacterium CG_4_10_14_0_8_um_filter_42_14]|nr:MAG: hypothetical protein COY80_00890 [Candidatus Pacebacteria bacterium CG_4_10_14_0_8_um_filter_42_14]